MPRIASLPTLGPTLGLLVALSGCPGDDTGTTAASTAADSTGNDGTTTADPPGTTSNGSADTTAASDPGTTTDAPGTTADAPGTTADEPGSTTDEGAACAMCVEDQCADELEACALDADCTCFQDCAAMNPGIAGALACASAENCDIPIAELMMMGTPVGDVAVCTQDNCPKCVM